MHSLGPPHQSQQFDGFHDRLANLHDEAVSTPPTTPGLAVAHSRSPPCPPHSFIHSNAGSPGWKLLISNPLTTDERTSLLTTIFSNRDEVRVIENLSGDDAQNFIDVTYEVRSHPLHLRRAAPLTWQLKLPLLVDQALDDLNHAPRVKCLRFLCKICGCQSLLPRSLVITASYDRTGVPLGHGGCADVWKGRSQGRDVAIKVLKMYQCSNHEQIRKFCKEVLMWKALRHPNVLPLLGVMMINTQFAMVSEWMVNGNIKEFVKAHTSADRLELLLDVARGLDYLHGQEMIHGDLKGANILIDSEGHARIADFGLLTMISDSTNLISSISRVEGGTTQWMSPELLDPERFGLDDSRPTEESDCYALGMVVYEVLSGHSPFPGCKDPVVIRKVMDGERPERPQAIQGTWFTDGLWEMLERCWEPRPDDRPSLKTIFQSLEGVARPLLPPSPTTTNEDTETDTDDMLDSPVTSPGTPLISPKTLCRPSIILTA
ncbi:kinase-like protein [Thelephora ganbajun]|uniref:Kinase-like protein n=1 Tax=Thelephora ganbajun TaxID=370292 RepID=A0ACB6Z5R5_THEGA|nr:kinase-like protein [Thelephora ganbajun]